MNDETMPLLIEAGGDLDASQDFDAAPIDGGSLDVGTTMGDGGRAPPKDAMVDTNDASTGTPVTRQDGVDDGGCSCNATEETSELRWIRLLVFLAW